MTLLTVIQKACDAMGLVRPSAVVSSTDQQVRQLYALANEEGEELARSYNWQALRIEQTFTTVAANAQPGAVPADWDRFINNSFFNRTQRREIIGPITPQQWQSIQAQPALNRVYLAFIERGGSFLVTPTPSAGDLVAYEYISNNWALSASSTPQSSFLADTDTTLLSERLMQLGIRWRFLSAKGLDYGEAMKTYEREKETKQARDGASGILTSTGVDTYIQTNIPEGNFPGP